VAAELRERALNQLSDQKRLVLDDGIRLEGEDPKTEEGDPRITAKYRVNLAPFQKNKVKRKVINDVYHIKRNINQRLEDQF
jgi:hypothetical protein